MRKAVIVSAVRAATGRYGGHFTGIAPEELSGQIVAEAVKRSGVNPEEIEDLILGNLYGQHGNIGRVTALQAGLPLHVGGSVIDRQCASSLQAIYTAAMHIMVGDADVYVAAGLEHMTREPWQLNKPSQGYQMAGPSFVTTRLTPDAFGNDRMGATAENVAEKYGITREECDEFALNSHLKAEAAIERGAFTEQILPIEIKARRESIIVDKDESVRLGQNIGALERLRPIFKENGVVTAGNACSWNDGAAALVLMSDTRAKELGLTPLATISSFATVGLDPKLMGVGPIYAIPKALKRAGMTMNDIDFVELNEAFAAQAIPCMRELNIPEEKVNPDGGAISLGHPLGATGAILTTKAVYRMKDHNQNSAIITMCVGGGQGAAMVITRH